MTVSSDLPKPFTRAEHEARLVQIQERMGERGIDALVVVDPANLFYVTGYDAWSFYVPQCLVIPGSGPAHLFGRPMDMQGAHYTAHVDDDHVHAYPEALIHRPDVHPFDWITARAREVGLLRDEPGFTVAAETDTHFFSPRGFRALQAGIPSASVVDAHELVNWVRLVKSPAEQDMLRAAGRIADSVMETAFAAIRPGRRQCDVVAEILAAQARGSTGAQLSELDVSGHGGSYPAIVPMLPTGPRAGTPHLTWSDAEFVPGEATALELAGCYRRYHAPLARTVSLGRPDPRLAQCADIVRDGMAAALETMRPGRPVGDAHRAFTQVITAHGMSKESRIGYSIGIGYPPDWGERTVSVRSDDETVLAPGMAFHVILGMWEQDWGYELSEPLLVSDGAPELLTHQPQELVAIT